MVPTRFLTNSAGDESILIESETRRRLEFRLLHHYIVQTSITLPASHNASVRTAWTVSVPRLANDYPPLLNAILSIAAVHLSKVETEGHSHEAVHGEYLALALNSHRRAISDLHSDNVDAVCFTSVLLIIDAYATLQDRTVQDPYEPPMQWLCMSNETRNVFDIGWRWIADNPKSEFTAIARSTPNLSDHEALFSECKIRKFAHLLKPVENTSQVKECAGAEDERDQETADAYEKTVAYVECIYNAIQAGEHGMGVCRWLAAFAVLIPRKMIDLVREKRPRALVVLAHYFALTGYLSDTESRPWWIGKVASKEIGGIYNCVPIEWHELMSWPLELTNAEK